MMRFERNLVGERIKVQWADRVGNDPQTNPLRWYDGTITHLNCRRAKHRVKYVHPGGPMVTANQRHVELESEWLELRGIQDRVQIRNQASEHTHRQMYAYLRILHFQKLNPGHALVPAATRDPQHTPNMLTSPLTHTQHLPN